MFYIHEYKGPSKIHLRFFFKCFIEWGGFGEVHGRVYMILGKLQLDIKSKIITHNISFF
jgi:hypothetical protein